MVEVFECYFFLANVPFVCRYNESSLEQLEEDGIFYDTIKRVLKIEGHDVVGWFIIISSFKSRGI